MTRIIKKSKKKRIEEPEVEPIEEGKDLSQSGNFFQNNKLLITWILVLAFVATCIGVTSLSSCSGDTKQTTANKEENKKNDNSKLLETYQKALAEEDSISNNANYAYACESAANAIMSDVFTSESKINQEELAKKQAEFEKYRADAIKHYEIAVERMNVPTTENSEDSADSTIADYSEIDRNYSDLSKLYIQTEQYQKVIDLAVKDKNIKEILDAPKDKISEVAKNLIETKSKDGIVIENSDFIPILSNYIIAKANTGKYSEVEQFVDVAMQYDTNNMALLLLVAQHQIDTGKLDEASQALGVANNLFSNTIMAYSSSVKDKKEDEQIAVIPYDYIMVAPQLYSMSGDILMQKNNKAQAALYYDFALQAAVKLGDDKLAEELLKKRASTGV
ncbi:hypothetical protein IJJ97_01110, partial [bacterium]|nr:hypothetical protein [bacterium]